MLIKANAVYEKFSKTIKKTTKYDVTGLHVTFSQTILKKLEPEGQAEATRVPILAILKLIESIFAYKTSLICAD